MSLLCGLVFWLFFKGAKDSALLSSLLTFLITTLLLGK